MLASEDCYLREKRPAESLVPALNSPLELSGKQIQFLLHAIRDLNPEDVGAEAEMRKRVIEIQKKAYQTYPYPCIHAFRHISLRMSENDAFSHILKAGRSSGQVNAPTLLDIGCCMGTDLRHAVESGYPPTSVIGCDIRRDFIDLGYALYGDYDTCPIPFFIEDVCSVSLCPVPEQTNKGCPPLKDVQSLNELRGQVQYIHAGSLFHLFDEETQEAIARRLVTLLDVTGGHSPVVVFGRQMGKLEEGVIDDEMCRNRYAHSPASWEKMWKKVLGEKNRVRVDTAFVSDEPTKLKAWNPGRGTEAMLWSVWVG